MFIKHFFPRVLHAVVYILNSCVVLLSLWIPYRAALRSQFVRYHSVYLAVALWTSELIPKLQRPLASASGLLHTVSPTQLGMQGFKAIGSRLCGMAGEEAADALQAVLLLLLPPLLLLLPSFTSRIHVNDLLASKLAPVMPLLRLRGLTSGLGGRSVVNLVHPTPLICR